VKSRVTVAVLGDDQVGLAGAVADAQGLTPDRSEGLESLGYVNLEPERRTYAGAGG
jgi:hypothetical protein